MYMYIYVYMYVYIYIYIYIYIYANFKGFLQICGEKKKHIIYLKAQNSHTVNIKKQSIRNKIKKNNNKTKVVAGTHLSRKKKRWLL